MVSLVNVLIGSSLLFKILWTADCPKPILDSARSQISSAAICCVIPSKVFIISRPEFAANYTIFE